MTKKQEVGYKVLYHKKERRSISRLVFEGGLIYLKNRKTTPRKNCGPICVFNSLEEARNFNKPPFISKLQANKSIIVKCKYKPSKETKIYSYIYRGEGYDYMLLVLLPSGTRLADSVTCLE